METSSAGSCNRDGSSTGKPVNGLMAWSSEPGSIVSEEDAIGDSVISVVLIVEIAVGVVVAGILGVQFPSTKDIKMIQRLGKRGKGRDIL
jgi:hypothetical protein